ncbi:hypothetical protein D7X30_00605 [Corallococcus sp. AB011P]|uniref:hypothetical protein n=1 Tax=unclassified Corallococcus TaxID=2685029 RepID=UPI000EA0EA80|nr:MULTISPECIES: hypothetical protein [unclassified Corallococcus]RKG61879.1 hypothetical protein D7X30_00605 [Corallococcus sp. AB011P]RKH88025.1 hypothetical protein D7Y21_16370 [Corallococcus sp. AB045]
MKYNQGFQVESVLDVLRRINEKYEEGSAEDEALRIAAVALIYIQEGRRLDEYRAFFRSFDTPAIEDVVVAGTFETRQAAEEWLESDKGQDGDLLRIAGQGFQVIRTGGGQQSLLRTPLPEELMKKFPPGPT